MGWIVPIILRLMPIRRTKQVFQKVNMVQSSMGGCEAGVGLGTALPATGEEGTADGLHIAASDPP